MRSSLERQINEARELTLKLIKDDPEALPGACLYHAVAINRVLGAPIVAGSYSWRFTTFDNGRNPTHFSCMFDERSKQVATELLKSDRVDELPILPEMHIWNLWQGKVLDITTLHLPAFAMRTCGFQFAPSLVPPLHHFGKAEDGKRGNFIYKADPLATRLARVAAELVNARNLQT